MKVHTRETVDAVDHAAFDPSLGVAVPRQLLHRRRIQCEAFHREDGQVDVDAWLLDTRGQDTPRARGLLRAGAPLHEMGLRLTVDLDATICAAHALTLNGPSTECADINPAYGKLVGLVIGPGLRKQANALLRGPGGCTHLTELLWQAATTALQAIWWLRSHALQPDDVAADAATLRRHVDRVIDTCHAWRGDGVMVHLMRERPTGSDSQS